jgi:hypothetical protein
MDNNASAVLRPVSPKPTTYHDYLLIVISYHDTKISSVTALQRGVWCAYVRDAGDTSSIYLKAI